MSDCKKINICFDDPASQKWCISLKEDAFAALMAEPNPTVHKIFGDGSLFSPFLFGKYFDPSDAFPLWDFNSDTLLSCFHSQGQSAVSWSQTDDDYFLKADLHGVEKNNVKVYVENGKIIEISGEWKHKKDSKTIKDWRSSKWWENGYVRRLELPEYSDWRKVEAVCSNDDVLLEIKIPKSSNSDGRTSEGSDH